MKPGVLAVITLATATALSFGQVSDDLKAKVNDAERNADFRNLVPADIAPEPDAAERPLRTVRGRLHNATRPQGPDCAAGSAAIHPSANRAKNDGCGPIPTRTLEQLPEELAPIHIDFPPMPDLPVKFSDTIVVGTVDRRQPYFSEDNWNIYTEYTITVREVLRDSDRLGLNPGTTIALDRMGGAIRLISGRVIRQQVEGNGAPLIAGHKYVLFLQYDARGSWFRSARSWELWNGVSVPVDPGDIAAAQRGQSRFAGMIETNFMAAVRDAAQRVGNQQ
jgi:hypothetical protein